MKKKKVSDSVSLDREGLSGRSAQDLIRQTPGFIVTWGNTILITLISFFFILCAFISYPDTVNAPAKLETVNGPKSIISFVRGKIIALKKNEGDFVRSGEIVAFIESTANHNDVLRLKDHLVSVYTDIVNDKYLLVNTINFNSNQNIGELQTAYQSYIQAVLKYRDYLPGGLISKKRQLLIKDIDNLKLIDSNVKIQQKLDEDEIDLQNWDLEMNEKLFKDKVISESEYKQAKIKLLNKQRAVPQNNLTSYNNNSNNNNKRKEIIEIDNELSQQKIIFLEALNTLKIRVDEWVQKYILTSPVDGILQFSGFLEVNHFIELNQVVFTVRSIGNQFYVSIVIPQKNFGKVRSGQKVLLNFDAFPSNEYGSVEGNIEYISPMPTDSGFLAKVQCSKGLVSNTGAKLVFTNGLKGSAEIVTDDRTLLNRLSSALISKLSN